MYAFPNAFWVDGWFWDGPHNVFFNFPNLLHTESQEFFLSQATAKWMKSHRQNVRHACLFCTWSIRRKMFEIIPAFKIVALSAEEIPTSNPPKLMNPPNWSWWNMINWTQFIEGAMDPSCLFISPISWCFFSDQIWPTQPWCIDIDSSYSCTRWAKAFDTMVMSSKITAQWNVHHPNPQLLSLILSTTNTNTISTTSCEEMIGLQFGWT